MEELSEISKHDEIIIRTRFWEYECGEPRCCYESSFELTINGVVVTKYFEDDPEVIKKVLEHLGYKNVKTEVDY